MTLFAIAKLSQVQSFTDVLLAHELDVIVSCM